MSFGTAHLRPPAFEPCTSAKLIFDAMRLGVTSFHVSLHYESFQTISRAFKLVRNVHPDCKPEFLLKVVTRQGPVELMVEEIRSQVEQAVEALCANKIDVVQWVCRGSSGDHRDIPAEPFWRSPILRATWRALKDKGTIGAVALFGANAEPRVLKQGWVDGLFGYLDPSRMGALSTLSHLTGSQDFVGLRPFAGGALLKDCALWKRLGLAPADALAFCLYLQLARLHSSSSVAGFSNSHQLKEAVAALAGTRSFEPRFEDVVEGLTERSNWERGAALSRHQ